MRRNRGILAAVGLFVLVGTMAALAAALFYPRLPDPEVADRDGLLRWLVTSDLSAESPTTRRVLVRRLDQEFSTGFDWAEIGDRLNQTQRQQLRVNIELLLEPWFMDKVDRYFQLTAAERPPYLKGLLETITGWQGLDLWSADLLDELCPKQTEAEDQGGLTGVLLRQVESWKKRADPQVRQRMDRFLWALMAQWMMRNTQPLAPAGP